MDDEQVLPKSEDSEEPINEPEVSESVDSAEASETADQLTTDAVGETDDDQPRVELSHEDVQTEFGLIRARPIVEEMTSSYLDYAMSVIVSRALPDVRDGLKPVHRRILYVMKEMGLTAGAKHQKSAKIVGAVMGSYHPHGDMAIYDALARQAQWWSMRTMLVNGQGNFGSMDGDPPAAQRYTEARLAKEAELLLMDIDKDTVDWRDNYDGSTQEPSVLPTRYPNLLINGSQGIAVGMATNVPPHNPEEIIDAALMLTTKPEATEEVYNIVKGPDFPTGAIIYNQADIKTAMSSGRGRIVVRGRAEIETDKKHRIVVAELPYQTNKAAFITHIAELVKLKKIEGITDIRDESDRQSGVRVVIELRSSAPAAKILNQLYELTELQTVVHYNMVALAGGLQPRLMNIAEILLAFLEHRRDVVLRRTKYELKLAEERAHILEGLKIALDNLDAVITLIRESASSEVAKKGLIEKFQLSERQSDAILAMRLSQLANLERQRVYDEYDALQKTIADLRDIIAKPERVTKIVQGELEEVKAQFPSPRRTEIRPEALGAMSATDLVPKENIIISLTQANYVKRLTYDTYKSQTRGGKGVSGTVRDDDAVRLIVEATTHDDILFFTDRGRAFTTKAYDIPAANRQTKGVALVNLIRLEPGERVTSALAVSGEDDNHYLFLATKMGRVKRVEAKQFAAIRRSGTIAMPLKGNDQLLWVLPTTGENEIVQITREGQVINYSENEVRSMGREASGVRGIEVQSMDEVIETCATSENADSVIVVSERGMGKRLKLSDLRNQHRGGRGVRVAKMSPKTGKMSAAAIATTEDDDLIIAAASGQVIRIPVKEVRYLSRQATGVILMRLNASDVVRSLAVLSHKEEQPSEDVSTEALDAMDTDNEPTTEEANG